MEKVKIKIDLQYDGHSVKKNGSVDLKFKIPYSELVTSLEVLQLLGCNMTLKCKVSGSTVEVGTFYLSLFSVDREGETTIKLNSELDSIELDNLNALAVPGVILPSLIYGMIEDEGEEEDE